MLLYKEQGGSAAKSVPFWCVYISAKLSTIMSAPASLRLSLVPLPYVTPTVVHPALRPMSMSKWVSPITMASSGLRLK